MRIAVTGRTGQVACSLVERGGASGHEIVAVGRPELDLAGQQGGIIRALEAISPQVIISSAAYTAVDKAESEPDLAFAVNERGAAAVAGAAAELGIPLIHLSTDYVFDGCKASPYVEMDSVGPTGAYGASKLAGERAVLAIHKDTAIVRTAWVYSPFGANFVKTMLQLANDRNEISVVEDQVGNPTSALDIADGILRIAANLSASAEPKLRGTFHMTAQGDGSWADFAEAVFDSSSAHGGPAAHVRRITSAEYPTPAKRPANSRLDSSRLKAAHGVSLPDWRVSLAKVVQRLVEEMNQAKVSRQ